MDDSTRDLLYDACVNEWNIRVKNTPLIPGVDYDQAFEDFVSDVWDEFENSLIWSRFNEYGGCDEYIRAFRPQLEFFPLKDIEGNK